VDAFECAYFVKLMYLGTFLALILKGSRGTFVLLFGINLRENSSKKYLRTKKSFKILFPKVGR
jgi:hypothetical protein